MERDLLESLLREANLQGRKGKKFVGVIIAHNVKAGADPKSKYIITYEDWPTSRPVGWGNEG